MNQAVEKKRISVEKPWMKYYSEDVRDLPRPETTAYRYMTEANADRLNEVAINYYGRKITHGALKNNIDAAADAFAAAGVKEGDIISFLSVATPETIYCIYALNKLGATANTIDPRMDIESIRRAVAESESKIFVVMDVVYEKISPIASELNQELIIAVSASQSLPLIKRIAMKLKVRTSLPYSKKLVSYNTFIKNGKGTSAVEAPYSGDAVFSIPYTGGTTGFAKGVMITNDGINSTAFNFVHAGLDYEKGDTFLDIIPVFTSYGMCCGMHMPLTLGLVLIPIPKFDLSQYGKLYKTFKPNHSVSTPAFYESLMHSKELKNMDLSFIKLLGSGGDTMNLGLEKKLNEFMKAHGMRYPITQGYGLSEASAAVTFGINNVCKTGSVGIPSLSITAGVFDEETGEELTYNEIGEICIAGSSLMKGYYKRKEETENVLRRHEADGKIWLHTGDLGYIDEDGFLFIIGRIKRMITRFDGHKVFPVSIESLVARHKEVKNCSAVGVADMERTQGHYPVVFVEFIEDIDDRNDLCKKIFKECHALLEERGRPVAVVPIDKIPLTGSGKNDFRTLEKENEHFDYKAWNAFLNI
ncbi:MAG: acyl--CoA ligase [Ruminococcaceae bacterium]|nr:acyl--CoA ligase [Oscillospiraceae bacterium]